MPWAHGIFKGILRREWTSAADKRCLLKVSPQKSSVVIIFGKAVTAVCTITACAQTRIRSLGRCVAKLWQPVGDFPWVQKKHADEAALERHPLELVAIWSVPRTKR